MALQCCLWGRTWNVQYDIDEMYASELINDRLDTQGKQDTWISCSTIPVVNNKVTGAHSLNGILFCSPMWVQWFTCIEM